METFDRAAAAVLSRASQAVRALPDSPQSRRAVVGAIAEALAFEAPSAAAPKKWPYLLAAGVALVAGAAWVLSRSAAPMPTPEPIVVNTPAPMHLPAPVVTPEPPKLEKIFASGARVSWKAGTELDFKDEETSVVLRRGEVAADAVSGVTIDTADTQVFVRGRARVVVGEGCDGRALVQIEAGESRIRSRGVETTLQQGAEWPNCTVAPKREVFTLEQQNSLFESAINAQRAGHVEEAVRSMETLIRRAPASVLAEPALAQEFRWLQTVDAERAKAAASRYISLFPMGPARGDAEQLLAQ